MAERGGSGDEGDCAGWVDAGDGGGEGELLILVCSSGGDCEGGEGEEGSG